MMHDFSIEYARRNIMSLKKICAAILSISVLLIIHVPAHAGSEADLYTFYTPQALVVMDLSGSMNWTPVGQYMYISDSASCGDDVAYYGRSSSGHSKRCDVDTSGVPAYSTETCSSFDSSNNLVPFYRYSKTGYSNVCTREAIARRVMFKLLDANNDGKVSSPADDNTFGVDIGYMRFHDCTGGSNETGTNYNSGCNLVAKGFGTAFSQIACASDTECTSDAYCGDHADRVCGWNSNGGTEAINALKEALSYITDAKSADSGLAKTCRKRAVILITDGQDTFYCSGSGGDWQGDNYKRRRGLVTKAKALNDAGYKVYVVGFGDDMPFYLRNTLNWAAYYGGTDSPGDANEGSVSAFTPPSDAHICDTASTTCYKYNCSSSTGLTCTTPTYTSCTSGDDNCVCLAASNDPGGAVVSGASSLTVNNSLEGYAFIATNESELEKALGDAFSAIKGKAYAFAGASISTTRIASENHLYEASFTYMEGDGFWQGHLKKYQIDTSGNVATSPLWDAGQVLADRTAARVQYTYLNGTNTSFSASNLQTYHLGLSNNSNNTTTCTQSNCTNIVKYFNGDKSYNKDGWYLGDIFHSNPAVISTPSAYFVDNIDANNAFASFRSSHIRSSDSTGGGRIGIVGANDGQLHVFNAYDGSEIFTFFPPNLLPKLQQLAHQDVGTTLGGTHRFFVDGPISAADVWFGTNGASKAASEWKTILVAGLGRGGDIDSSPEGNYLWSRNSSCAPTNNNSAGTCKVQCEKWGLLDSNGVSAAYDSAHPYYCGYWAFNFNDTLNSYPTLQWPSAIRPSAAEAPYLGEPWSKMAIGRVKTSAGAEKWVGVFGGGGFQYSCSGSNNIDMSRTIGKGIFIVDLNDGSILRSFVGVSGMMPIFAPPAIADTNGDGFIDVAYVGDMGGNMWRVNLAPGTTWSVTQLYNQTTGQIRPIYGGASVAKDNAGRVWVFWGTGDRQCPTDSNQQELVLALQDDGTGTTLSKNSMDNITSSGGTYGGTSKGWYMNLTNEKMEGDPVVFAGTLYFTTYKAATGGDSCNNAGTAYLYGVGYNTGAGMIPNSDGTTSRSKEIGAGIPSSPLVSRGPDGKASVYVTVSGGLSTTGSTFKALDNAGGSGTSTNIMWWKDRRIQ